MRLLTLPLRLSFKLLRGALSLVQGPDEPGPTPTRVPPQPRYRRSEEEPAGNGGAPASPEPAAPTQATAPPQPADPLAPAEPIHVSEEPELVAEVAERGAEEGAGAELHVDEPWPGYARMTAAEIRDRLRGEGPAAAAAVRLYEAANKGRSSVLEAAGREINARPSG
jgi:hypothetical protein